MVKKLKEGIDLSAYEISRMLVDAGFGNEEEGFLDYFLEDNPKYCASVNLEDMGAYVEDLNNSEHIPLPFANGKVRMILKTKEDVNDFLSFIDELNYDGIFESTKRTRRAKKAMKVNEARIGKTKSVYVSQEYVPGYGWEDVTVYDDTSNDSYKLAKQDVKDYRDNGYNARMITRKIDNPDYVEPTYDLTYDAVIDWVENECPYDYKIEDGFMGKYITIGNYDVSISLPNGPDSVFDNKVTVTDIFEKRTYRVNTLDELIKKVDRIVKKYEKWRSERNG